MNKRIAWIDCAKLIAIMAVVTDHCSGFLYTSPYIACSSYFSVSLFVLLSGVSTWMAYVHGKEISFSSQRKKIYKLLSAYAIATFIVLCIRQEKFDLKIYIDYLLNFNIEGPYYYLVFFIQLLLVAPVLVSWCRFANRCRYKWLIQTVTLSFLGWFASVCIHYTYLLPVHGGGKFLGGYIYSFVLSGNGFFQQWSI